VLASWRGRGIGFKADAEGHQVEIESGGESLSGYEARGVDPVGCAGNRDRVCVGQVVVYPFEEWLEQVIAPEGFGGWKDRAAFCRAEVADVSGGDALRLAWRSRIVSQ
jgi:hypothetical protein